MKKCLKVLGVAAIGLGITAAVSYAMEQVRRVRDYAPEDWDDVCMCGCKGKPCGGCSGDGGCHGEETHTVDGHQCHHVASSCFGVGVYPDKGVTETPTESQDFCPYGEVGCLSPKDFEEGTTVCPCAGEGCLRKHTVTKPDDEAFGGQYGGHGLHAEQVAFGDKEVAAGAEDTDGVSEEHNQGAETDGAEDKESEGQ